jgi:hypothetical protein
MTPPEHDPYAPPRAFLESGAPAAAFELRQRPVWLVVLLSAVTAGIYDLYWLHVTSRALNAFFRGIRPIASAYVVLGAFARLAEIAVAVAVGAMPEAPDIRALDSVSRLVAALVLLAWRFRVRDVLSSFVSRTGRGPFPLGKVATFFLGIYYLQYKINRLPDPQPAATDPGPPAEAGA